MDRRGFLTLGGAAGLTAAASRAAQAQQGAGSAEQGRPAPSSFSYDPGVAVGERLPVPSGRRIKVAFAVNPGVQVIDLAGPWETFQDTGVRPGEADVPPGGPAFDLYTVSESREPIRGSGGFLLAAHYTVDDAPQPDVTVVPHFAEPAYVSRETSAIHDWIRSAHAGAALTMSVCTGAFQLAKTGLLDGRPATTNQNAYDAFAKTFPEVDLRRGPRFVETGRIATAGGLSAGIDLALRVVARFFSEERAQRTADIMEYVGQGWRT